MNVMIWVDREEGVVFWGCGVKFWWMNEFMDEVWLDGWEREFWGWWEKRVCGEVVWVFFYIVFWGWCIIWWCFMVFDVWVMGIWIGIWSLEVVWVVFLEVECIFWCWNWWIVDGGWEMRGDGRYVVWEGVWGR